MIDRSRTHSIGSIRYFCGYPVSPARSALTAPTMQLTKSPTRLDSGFMNWKITMMKMALCTRRSFPSTRALTSAGISTPRHRSRFTESPSLIRFPPKKCLIWRNEFSSLPEKIPHSIRTRRHSCATTGNVLSSRAFPEWEFSQAASCIPDRLNHHLVLLEVGEPGELLRHGIPSRPV